LGAPNLTYEKTPSGNLKMGRGNFVKWSNEEEERTTQGEFPTNPRRAKFLPCCSDSRGGKNFPRNAATIGSATAWKNCTYYGKNTQPLPIPTKLGCPRKKKPRPKSTTRSKWTSEGAGRRTRKFQENIHPPSSSGGQTLRPTREQETPKPARIKAIRPSVPNRGLEGIPLQGGKKTI